MTVDLEVPARALAIGAHPDDIEFECGATLAKWAEEGCEIGLLVLTDGSKGTWDAEADLAALAKRRAEEQAEAARRLSESAAVRMLGAVDGELEVTMELRSAVAKVIRELKPQVVLGHDPWQRWRLHPDHRAAGFLTTDAVVAARDPHFFSEHGIAHHRPDEVLLFECEEPDHFESVTEAHLETKVQALLAHESQFETTHEISNQKDIQPFRDKLTRQAQQTSSPFDLGEGFRRLSGV